MDVAAAIIRGDRSRPPTAEGDLIPQCIAMSSLIAIEKDGTSSLA